MLGRSDRIIRCAALVGDGIDIIHCSISRLMVPDIGEAGARKVRGGNLRIDRGEFRFVAVSTGQIDPEGSRANIALLVRCIRHRIDRPGHVKIED